MGIWECFDYYRIGLPAHPNPESLLSPPYEVWHDNIRGSWLVKSLNKPKNALVYGIKWEEKIKELEKE